MMIKSALMTTAYDVLDGPNTNPLVIFRQGAGHVKPNSAADPGLVYNSGWNDWLGFLCGTPRRRHSFCTGSGIAVLDTERLQRRLDRDRRPRRRADREAQRYERRQRAETYTFSSIWPRRHHGHAEPDAFTRQPGGEEGLRHHVHHGPPRRSTRTSAGTSSGPAARATWSGSRSSSSRSRSRRRQRLRHGRADLVQRRPSGTPARSRRRRAASSRRRSPPRPWPTTRPRLLAELRRVVPVCRRARRTPGSRSSTPT